VFTNGVFDLLHRGHVTYLARARALGAALLVALNTDASARRLGKGAERPLNALEDRMAVLAALESVDAVTWFDEDTPEVLIAGRPPPW
jgi:rfaE bifunctional protein nucleotidyltransferase chain/domain